MSDIQPYQPRSLVPAGRTGRALNRVSNETSLSVAVIQAKTEIECTRVSGVSAVAATALNQTALLTQMEQSLAQSCPAASGRLAVIADLTAMTLADVVTTAARRIGN